MNLVCFVRQVPTERERFLGLLLCHFQLIPFVGKVCQTKERVTSIIEIFLFSRLAEDLTIGLCGSV